MTVESNELSNILAGNVEPEPEVEGEELAEEEAGKEEPEPVEGEAEGEEETPTEGEEDPYASMEEQNRELRQILRQQKRDLSVMREKLSRLERKSAAASKEVDEAGELDELYGEPQPKRQEAPEEVSALEQAQQELATIAQVKGPILETLLEVMEMNPQYSDVRDVCSQSNFDDVFEAVGNAIAEKEGKDSSLAALEAEAMVWKMPNPYKYMYSLIKEHHPKYIGKGKTPAAVATKEPPKAVKAPSSLANVPGKSAGKNAWSAARIDEMDEMELDAVPADIYEKYLRGDLE